MVCIILDKIYVATWKEDRDTGFHLRLQLEALLPYI